MVRTIRFFMPALMSASVAWAAPLETRGRVDAVTVYRGQALVTRLVEAGGEPGLREIVVTDLPEAVVPGSIYAESADGVEIRSVSYRTRPVSADVREEVRKLDEQIRALGDQLAASQRQTALLAEHKAYLAKLEQFVAPTATVELTKGVLNAETLKELSSYLLEQRQLLVEEEQKRSIEQRTLQEQSELLNRQRQVLTEGSSNTAREAVVFVELGAGDKGTFRLRYLVGNANWSPSYNMRADADLAEVRVEYYSSIQQMSGEDWSDVNMTLSTATPALVAKAPVLDQLAVALASLEQAQQKGVSDYLSAREELGRKKSQAEQSRNQAFLGNSMLQIQSSAHPQAAGPAGGNDFVLNEVGKELQLLDLIASGGAITRSNKAARTVTDEGVSVTYQLAGRISLPSRSDQQLIQIASTPMKADAYKLAIPLLTSYVYNEASVTNNGSMVLLAGPVSAYLAGQFVGHGELPTVAIGESFTVGFGIDSSLRATRELLEKGDSVQGGNRVMDFTYRLALENFGGVPAKVRLLDRLPTTKDGQIRIELTSKPEHELSQDSTYQQTERKKGILRWEVEVPAQAIATKALNVDYKVRMEFDKQMAITGMPVASAR